VKLHHPDQVRRRLVDQGLTEEEAAFLIHLVEGEYGFVEPPAGESVPMTLRVLATIESLKETLSDLDQDPALLEQ
jgi:hypothetical protein